MPNFLLITKYDKIIMAFLKGNSNIQKVVMNKKLRYGYLSNILNKRIKIRELEEIKSYAIDGETYVEINPSFREINLLKYDNITKDMEKRRYEIQMRRDNKVSKRRNCYVLPKVGSIEDQENLLQIIKNTVSVICLDFSESDKQFMIDDIYGRLKNGTNIGRSFEFQTAVIIYLLSKCPANSGKPLQFKEVYRRLVLIDPKITKMNFFDLTCHFKELGVKSCRVTYEMAIKSRKESLQKLVKDENVPQIAIDDIMKSVVEICNSSKFKRTVMGRDPYVVASAIVCYTKKLQPYVSQKKICDIFGVTGVSTRKIIKQLDDLFGVIEDQKRISKGITMITQNCPVCGVSFELRKSQYKKFCSMLCSHKGRNGRVSVILEICPTCEGIFNVNESGYMGYCSKECYHKSSIHKLSAVSEKAETNGEKPLDLVVEKAKTTMKEYFFLFLDEKIVLVKDTTYDNIIKLNSFFFFLNDKSFWKRFNKYQTMSYHKWKYRSQSRGIMEMLRRWAGEYATTHGLKSYFNSYDFGDLGTVKFINIDSYNT